MAWNVRQNYKCVGARGDRRPDAHSRVDDASVGVRRRIHRPKGPTRRSPFQAPRWFATRWSREPGRSHPCEGARGDHCVADAARAAPGVLTSSVDGRVVDTTRYRSRARDWVMQYWAVPDTGAIVALSISAGGHIDFDLAARRPGIPPSGVTIPPRPPYVVPSQTGDVSIVYRQSRF